MLPARTLVRQNIDRVGWGSSAGTESWSCALSLVLVAVPVSRCARLEDQLGLDGEAYSEIADGGDIGTCRPRVTSVGNFPASCSSALQLILQQASSARTSPVANTGSHLTRTQKYTK